VKKVAQFFIFVLAGAGLFLFFTAKNDFKLSELSQTASEQIVIENSLKEEKKIEVNLDIAPQKPLENPPEVIKAVYATGWTAGGVQGLNRMINLIKSTELNAIIVDIKDYSGELSYRTEIPEVEEYSKDRDLKILRPNAMIKRLHDEGIYVIARQTVFQDPILAAARPELALTSSSTGKQWLDNKKVMWVDSASKEVWDYNIAIAKDALARGFDEVNFDYIRFASDGNLDDIIYPFWDEVTLKRTVIREFWKYLRQALPNAKISADLFGLVTVNYGDVGIGQNIEDAFHYFDAIAPMVYPSHYSSGFNGYKNPAEHPYGVVLRSMEEANQRLKVYKQNAALSTSTEKYLVKEPKLRPWLQDFDLGADYDAAKVRDQIMATYVSEGACEKVATTTDPSGFLCDGERLQESGGWMLWDPRNVYTRGALLAD
jgi:hypothetical protein